MRRRAYLGSLAGLGSALGLAGCTGLSGGGDGDESPSGTGSTPPGTAQSGATQRGVTAPEDVSLPVPESALHRSAGKDAIPAIVDPAFGPDWTDVSYDIHFRDGTSERYEPELSTDDEVLGVVDGDTVRAYPLTLLRWHEVVNDTLSKPMLVTFCPICQSGVVADRTVDGTPATFGVSGLLWHADLVMYDDETESLWSQLLATAIRGPRTGRTLDLHPVSRTTWAEWRERHPATEVLLPPPLSGTVVGEVRYNYDIDIAGRQNELAEQFPELGSFGQDTWTDTRLRRRTMVLGVAANGEARAYPRQQIEWDGPIHETVGGLPVVVTLSADGSMVAWDRRIDGEAHTFEPVDDAHLLADGSRWHRLTGEAVDGPHEGEMLVSATDTSTMFWFAWLTFHPETTVYGRE
ncbi:DUF3179 domain-containing protein [Haloarchaeobius sp. HME9146]|uniref:DUF3179 domain-containing protein n=1 Tax=Haloarchaeobius sp. HME9146 TaxID=2978732 RepID=UPI0021C0CB70|nr:DUF3179 domain-containing protein [Haloarchaeobius sp. HME9146]MCT9097598.1 DUF3179 domain-containing protein [Haloarchaeobius sp. HME9146]